MLWQAIKEASISGSLDLARLRATFVSLSPREQDRIREEFYRAIERLDVEEVRAAYIDACDFPSDDGYDYFRAAIIGSGKRTFRAVIENPSLARGMANEENEELYYALDVDDDSEDPGRQMSEGATGGEYASVSDENEYPVEVGRYPLSIDLSIADPIDAYRMWIRAEVQDSTLTEVGDFAYDGGVFRMYPQADIFWQQAAGAASLMQRTLEGVIDYRQIPGECIHVIVRLSEQESPPREAYVTSTLGPFWLSPGIIVEVEKSRIFSSSDKILREEAERIIRSSVIAYFGLSFDVASELAGEG